MTRSESTAINWAFYRRRRGPECVAIGDLNGDSKPDPVVSNEQDDHIVILFGKARLLLNAPLYGELTMTCGLCSTP